MTVTLMPSAKILLDLTLVSAKTVFQEMDINAKVRFIYLLLTSSPERKASSSYSDLCLFPTT